VIVRRGVAALAGALALSACVGGVVPPTAGTLPTTTSRDPVRGPVRQPTAATPIAPVAAITTPGAITAVSAGLIAGPPTASLPITADAASRALAAFRISCPSLVRRTDPTGLTRGADWQPACDAAARTSGDARGFFAQWFETVQVGDGKAFATGYYIPEIAGGREYRDGFAPIYARPSDLIDVDLGQFSTDLKGKKIRGRVEGTNFIPYFDRTAIEEGALRSGKARILGYAVDPVELFFLQVQGSGLVRLPDGEVLRIGYESQNGRDYTGIGKLMLDRGLIQRGQASMQGIVAWLHANPEQGRAIMRENKSYVFFRLLDGPPLGAMGLPVSDGATVAADVRFVPLGAPVFLSMDRTDATGLWVAQDTGGAIKGTNRFDTFWGAGDEARAIAGGMSARGTAFVLVPLGTLARLGVAQSRP
jgi:membrane-bound lytic murein transglycosylase A